MRGFLLSIPTGVIVVILVGVMVAALEAGRHLARREGSQYDNDSRSHASNLHTAMLGLLALLLGFTFSMATERFQTVRDLVVEEANAIDTAYHRADLVEEPERGIIKDRLTRFVDADVAFYAIGIDEARRQAVAEEVEGLEEQIWAQAVRAAQRAPTTTTALLVQSVNQVRDTHIKRRDTSRHHVPAIIIWLLAIMSVASIGLTGYVSRFGNRQHPAPTAIVLTLIALVIGVIVELDRPTRGLIQGGDESILDLQRELRDHGPVTR